MTLCFGNSTQSTQTYQANPATVAAANKSAGYIQNLAKQGFQPFPGGAAGAVANFSPEQAWSQNATWNLAQNGYTPEILAQIGQYSRAPAASVSADTIANNIAPYMNRYTELALDPQLRLQQQQFADQDRQNAAAATQAGAYGDTGYANLVDKTRQSQDQARTGLIGQAYNAAFNTALGAGAQDVATKLGAQTTNASLYEQMLGRELSGASALEGLGGYQTGLFNATNQMGAQQTGQEQAQKNFNVQQWLMQQQYGPMIAQLMNQNTGALGSALGGTTTKSAPDNSGFGALGGALGSFAGSDAGSAWITGLLPFAAKGGRPHPGQPTVVGEEGPETFVPDFPGLPPQKIGVRGPEVIRPNHPGTVVPNPATVERGIRGYAFGGMPTPGQPAMVGERGPETFVPHNPASPPMTVGAQGPQIMTPSQPGTVMPNPSTLLNQPPMTMPNRGGGVDPRVEAAAKQWGERVGFANGNPFGLINDNIQKFMAARGQAPMGQQGGMDRRLAQWRQQMPQRWGQGGQMPMPRPMTGAAFGGQMAMAA